MKFDSGYKIFGSWARALEPPSRLAVRLKLLIESLVLLTPRFATWYQVDYAIEEFVLVDSDLDAIARRIAHRTSQSDRHPREGFFSFCATSSDTESDCWGLTIRAGGAGAQYIELQSSFANQVRESGIDFNVARGAIRCFRDSFGAEWCAAFPMDLRVDPQMYDGKRPYTCRAILIPRAWMIELSPRLAQYVAPPPNAIHEYLAGGSLFMAATRETFSTDNPQHFAAAQAILAVVDPLNYVADQLPLS